MRQLVKLALPVIATSFISMAYNFINMIFVGHLGSNAVAAVGSAGFYMNLSWAISSLFTVGVGVKVSHSVGAKKYNLVKSYIKSGLTGITIASIIFYLCLIFASKWLIALVGITDQMIIQESSTYLNLIGISILFSFQNLYFTSAYIGLGDSKTPFRINTLALIINIVLDPILIYGAGFGIHGAALSTVISQLIATVLFYQKNNKTIHIKFNETTFRITHLKQIMFLGSSPTIQRVSFTFIAIGMARIISDWGAEAIAVQKVGVQIEAITYMTAGGFMSAISSLSGKAFGEGNYQKQWETFRSGLTLSLIIGITTTFILILFPETLFSLFLNDPKSLQMGKEYLIILGYSQLFMCIELMTTGSFFGWGKTNIPAITGISLTLARIPISLALIHYWQNTLSSVWWSISISSIAKGIILLSLYIILFKLFILKIKSTENEKSRQISPIS